MTESIGNPRSRRATKYRRCCLGIRVEWVNFLFQQGVLSSCIEAYSSQMYYYGTLVSSTEDLLGQYMANMAKIYALCAITIATPISTVQDNNFTIRLILRYML